MGAVVDAASTARTILGPCVGLASYDTSLVESDGQVELAARSLRDAVAIEDDSGRSLRILIESLLI